MEAAIVYINRFDPEYLEFDRWGFAERFEETALD